MQYIYKTSIYLHVISLPWIAIFTTEVKEPNIGTVTITIVIRQQFMT